MLNDSFKFKATSYTPIAIILLMLAVMLGAFGSHGLKDMVTAARLLTWQTAVDYQMSQALGLLVISFVEPDKMTRWFNWGRKLLVVGMIIFSGSLYILVLTDIGVLGAITPIGGTALIAGWFFMFLHFMNK